MRVSDRIGFYLVTALVIGVLGCATYPISKQYQSMASKDVNFSMVLANPDAYMGAIVIWGGRIVETTNTPQGSEITVLETPLNGWEEPSSPEYSPGRFVAKSSDFLPNRRKICFISLKSMRLSWNPGSGKSSALSAKSHSISIPSGIPR